MRAAPLVLALTAQLAAADLLSYHRGGNLFLLLRDDGAGELEWVTGATFRYRRRLANVPSDHLGKKPVTLEVTDLPDRLKMRSESLTVTMLKAGMELQVTDSENKLLATFADGAMDREFELRKYPFFLTAAGYGLGTDRKGNCFFYYGPLPKGILEERAGTVEAFEQLNYGDVKLLTPASLPRQATRMRSESLEALVQEAMEASLSGVLAPALNVGAWANAPDALRRHALQLASIFPLIYAPQPLELGDLRGKLASYLVTYFWEARQRGLPLIRPLAMQFSHDPAAVSEKSVFMLGDELLIVPLVSESPRLSFYLPQGIWTDLATNERRQGRQKLEITASDRLPIYLRNGSILPLDGDPMILHYTPMLPAEFFLYEPALDDYSQMHAGPAVDFVRLEMEMKKSRSFEWIIHHVERPKDVERAGSWRYDEKSRNLHVMVRAEAGADVIVNIQY